MRPRCHILSFCLFVLFLVDQGHFIFIVLLFSVRRIQHRTMKKLLLT